MKNLQRYIRLSFIILFTFTLYGIGTLLAVDDCKKKKWEQNIICKSISLFTYPSLYMLDGIKQTKRLMTEKSTSGLIVKNKDETLERFKKLKNGFSFNYLPGSRKNAGFLLLAFADPKRNGYPVIELWDMNLQKKIHSYDIDVADISEKLEWEIKPQRNRFRHPLLLTDGSILINELGTKRAIIKLDQCGKFIKANELLRTHHGLEMDKEGKIYSPVRGARILKDKNLHPISFVSDGFAIYDQDLNILGKYSLLDIYEKNDLATDIYGNQEMIDDPFHLNDVQPYISPDGSKYVLLSMKGHSRIMALNLENLEVLWFIDRATSLQHDVDILNENKNSINISIFDNNTRMYQNYKNFGNQVAFLDNLPIDNNFETFSIGDKKQYDKYQIKYEKFESLSEEMKPKTRNEGRADIIIENNSLMIEETNFGRLIEIDTNTGEILWQYYNLSEGEMPFIMNWSRRLSKLPKGLDTNEFQKCLKDE